MATETTERPANGQADDNEKTGRQRDPELLTIERMQRMLDELPAVARRRVMVYLSYRNAGYDVAPDVIVE